MFLLWFRQLPQCGDRTPASGPPPARGKSTPTNTPIFLPSSFVLPTFAWVYIFFSIDQVLLHFCVWRLIPDVSMERDVFHVHLLFTILILLHLTHLVSAGCRRHWTMIYHIHWYIHGLGKPSPTLLWKKKKKGCLGASPPTFNLSQHQGLFKWVSSLHQVAKLLELKHQSFQWIFRTDFL